MLFKSNGKFIDDVTDSFNRFGIQTKLSEKGSTKDIQKFEMYDSIHDSGYIAVASSKAVGKNAIKEWEKIIDNDLMPSLMKEKSANSDPASALIVPSKDIDKVESLLKKKGLDPTIYQLFPGYVVAGINKRDTSKLIKDFEKKQNEELKKQEENKKADDTPQTPEKVNNVEKKQEIEPVTEQKTIKNKQDLLKELNNDKQTSKPVQTENKAVNKNIPKPEKSKPLDKKAKSSIAKKLAAAALMGTAVGLGIAAAPDIQNKIENFKKPDNISIEENVMEEAAKRYFDGLKNGFDEDEELLKTLAKNPKLAEKYIKELADTPVQTEALKNPSQPVDNLVKKSNSANEEERSAVAENPSTPQDVLNKLAHDESINVLKSLSKNPSISKELMDNLSNYSGLHKSLLDNPALTPDVLTKIAAGKQRDCEFNRKYMSNPCVSIQELVYNKNNPDECVRQGIAQNPNTPVEVVSALANDKNPAVRQAALKNKNLPEDEINKLFPPHWLPDKNNTKLEADRLAALENPNIDNRIIEKATFIEPVYYGRAAAKNQNLPASTVNKMVNKARGKSGLKNFIANAENIKNNPDKIKEIENQMTKNKEPLNKPLRRMLNKDFAEKVYDPYFLIDSMRKVPAKKRKYDLTKNNTKTNNNTSNVLDNIRTEPSSVISADGSVPNLFSKLPLPPVSKRDLSYNPDAEINALKTADSIVDDVMKSVLPGVEKAVNNSKSGKPVNQNKGSAGNSNSGSNNSSSNGSSPVNSSSAANSGITGGGNNNIVDLSPDNMITFKNACSRIDSLFNMY